MATFPAVFRLLTPGTTSAPDLIHPDGSAVSNSELPDVPPQEFIWSQPQSGPQELIGYDASDVIETPYQAAFAAGISPGAIVVG